MNARAATIRNRIALTLLGLVLAIRVLVPAGWMPAAQGGFAVTICSGTTTQTLWVDSDGKMHKPAPTQSGDQHCAFAGLGAPMLSGEIAIPFVPVSADTSPAIQPALASIGQGLAAPPPPATGPPTLI